MRKDDGLETAAVNGFTASPEIVGIVKAKGGPRAFSYVMADGRVLPAVMGGSGEGEGQAGNGNGNGSQGNAGNNGGNGGSQKVEFSPGQQARVQELIDGTFAKAFGKAKQEYEAKLAAATAEIEKLKTANGGQGNAGNQGGNGNNQELKSAIEALTAEREAEKAERARERASALQKIKNAEIIKALSKHEVLDAESIARLVADAIEIDNDEKITVKGVNGPKLSLKTGENMSLDEFLSGWLAEKPHFLRASGSQGAGSQGAKFGPGGGQKYDLSDPATWRNMPREELDKILRDGVNIPGANGQLFRFAQPGNRFLEARRAKFAKQK